MATNIKFPEGTTYRHEFVLVDDNRAAIDLTGAAITFAAYTPGTSNLANPTAFLLKTQNDYVVPITPSSGIIRVDFLPTETADKAGTYEWELEVVEINGDVWLGGKGILLITPSRRLDGS